MLRDNVIEIDDLWRSVRGKRSIISYISNLRFRKVKVWEGVTKIYLRHRPRPTIPQGTCTAARYHTSNLRVLLCEITETAEATTRLHCKLNS